MQEPPVRDDGLQLEEHPRFQRAFWRAERFAWVGFILILLLALAGLTGAGGYLAQGTVTLAGGELQFPRVARWSAADQLRVRFDAGPDRHTLSLGHGFYEYFQVEGIQPEPARSVASAVGITMEFPARDAGPVHVVLYVRPLRPGFPRYPVHLDAGKTDVSAVVLP